MFHSPYSLVGFRQGAEGNLAGDRNQKDPDLFESLGVPLPACRKGHSSGIPVPDDVLIENGKFLMDVGFEHYLYASDREQRQCLLKSLSVRKLPCQADN